MNQRKNAFTLIELLAVIVILAIIALIATPIILNIIEKSKKSAFVDSAYGLIEAAKLEYTEGLLQNTSTAKSYTFPQTGTDKLEFSGGEPSGGSIKVSSTGQVSIAIHDGTWCAIKSETDSQVTISKYDEKTCILPVEEQLTYTPEKCFEFDNATGTITKYNKSDSDCGVDVVIPETIGGVTVKAIESYAFVTNHEGETLNEGGDCKKLNSVIFPSGLESIGERAFYGSHCFSYNKITELDFSRAKSLTTIGNEAFSRNKINSLNLKGLTKLTTIGESAFYNSFLTTIDFSNLINLQTIGADAFVVTETITFGSINKLETIGTCAFRTGDPTSLSIDNIPTSVTSANEIKCVYAIPQPCQAPPEVPPACK